MGDRQNNSNHEIPWQLTPLTPEFIEKEHGRYVAEVNRALGEPEIRNIALSGNFGVGKSSILKEVAKSHPGRVIEISLSTLAPTGGSAVDQAESGEATTPTNVIQREIVKQLLYREDPNKTTASRFQRIQRFRWWRELAIAILFGFVIAIALLLTSLTEQVASEVAPGIKSAIWTHVAALTLVGCLTLAVRRLFHGKINIGKISAGSATITLDDKAGSYFDQYLDEIVYLFEVSNYDTVIFEDIDRFDDSRIFETLQSLNTLLNVSRRKEAVKWIDTLLSSVKLQFLSPYLDKVRQNNRPVRFIYAIKDSIFDLSELKNQDRKPNQDYFEIADPAQAEAVRANRTKFFDLVIPVVPFITHRSARNLTDQLLKGIDQDINSDLIDLAARYVPEMRLLKNVRNEFIVFRDRIFFSDEGQNLALTETELFAMMLYKSTHLSDFEAIRIGESNLDKLYDISRKLVRANIQYLEEEIRDINRRLNALSGKTERSKELGRQVINQVELAVKASNYPLKNGKYYFNDRDISKDTLYSVDFWAEYIRDPEKNELRWQVVNNHNQKLRFKPSDLEKVLDSSLDPEDWDEANREELNIDLKNKKADIKVLRGADLGDLIREPRFKLSDGESSRSLDEFTRKILPEGMAYHLIFYGYISGNFTLYTSTFHGSFLSANAQNFIIHHVERNVMDEQFLLKPGDVDSVIHEKGERALKQPALYNISILNHLLQSEDRRVETMVESLAELGEDQKRFIEAFLNSSSQRRPFVRRFAAVSSDVLVYLVGQVELDEDNRLACVNEALIYLGDKEYQTDRELAAYLLRYYSQMQALTSDSLGYSVPKRAGKIFLDSGVQVPDLTPLSVNAKRAFVELDLYEINKHNLGVALGNKSSLALDVALNTKHEIYEYLIQNLDDYVAVVKGNSSTVESASSFNQIIEDVLVKDSDQINDIISNASSECQVENLRDISITAWPYLAYYRRFPCTFNNVLEYVNEIGSLDENLAITLSISGAILEHEEFEENDKVMLAKRILEVPDEVLHPDVRVRLIRSLNLQHHIDASGLPSETLSMFPLLLEHDVIEDSAGTYAQLSNTDWATRERFIEKSGEFKNYMTPDLVQRDVAELLASDRIDEAIQGKVADNPSEYIESDDSKSLAQLAQFSIKERREVSYDVVDKMAKVGVPAHDVLILLRPYLGTLASEKLSNILHSLGGKYSELVTPEKRKVDIPNTVENHELAKRIKQLGLARSQRRNGDKISIRKH